MITLAEVGASGGLRLLITGLSTVNTVPALALLETPFTVTTTFPVVDPLGAETTIWVLLQLVMVVAEVPLKVTVLVPRVAPKFVPVIVTDAPKPPAVGDKLVTPGVGMTVKLMPLLATPAKVTRTLPVVAPPGTETKILVA